MIACRFVLDLGEAETAAVLGIAHGTVKSRTARALERLRGELGGRHDARARPARPRRGFPEAPQLAPRVLAAVGGATARRRRRRRIAVLALALFLLVPATALAVSGDLRDRVLDAFGLRDVKITSVQRLPEAGPEARQLQLGPRVSPARARRDLNLAVRPPSVLGAPDGTFEDRLWTGVEVTFLYQPATVAERIGVHERVLVSIVRGSIGKTILGKTVVGATKATTFEIDGGAALLLTGHTHLLVSSVREAASTRSPRGSPARRSCGSGRSC